MPLPEIVAECRDVNGVDCRDIADFIENARQDIPYLLDVIEQQQAEIERLKPLAELGELAIAGLDKIANTIECKAVYDSPPCQRIAKETMGCALVYFCRKRAELRGEPGERL